LLLDREFSYLELLENLVPEGISFVIRLKVEPHFCDGEGKPVFLSVSKGEPRILNNLFYKGKVFVNVIGVWKKGYSEPIWTMTNLDANEGLAFYDQRMKIEETFRDLKNLLNFHKLMNKRRVLMEKMVALILIASAIILVVGEALRAQLFPEGCRKYKLYSGSFVFLKLKPDLSPPLLTQTCTAFSHLVLSVRNNV
jgi:hypothetical protein